jgi:hypothetical protein|tara:strand:+ start:104 stop:304 length:201 start_codon:yes stop_codon:yes gene_type:complete
VIQRAFVDVQREMAARNARLSWPNTRIHKAPTPLLRIGGRAYGPLTALYPAALLHDDVITVVGAAA